MHIRMIQPRELFGPPERQAELEDCWQRSWGLFDSYQTPSGQPHFNELFDLCGDGMLNVIANSDMYFDQAFIDHLRSLRTNANTCLAMSRWNMDEYGRATLWDHRDSQDVWIFNGKPRGIDAGFRVGVPGCDNHLLWLIQQAGYKVTNPAKTIKAYHLHNVTYRSYLSEPSGRARGGDKIERVPGPYAFCNPTHL